MTATGVGDPAAQRIALLSGAAAATAYMAAVIIGGLITPGYSQIQDDVSALIQRGAPQKAVLDPMFYAFNLLVIVYGVAVFRSVRWSLRRRRLGLVGSVALALGGLFGVLVTVFPRDPAGEMATLAGKMHLILVGVTAPLYLVTLGCLGLWFLARPRLRWLGWYSLATLLLLVVTGPLTVVLIESSVMGLLERGTGFGFAAWLFVSSLMLARHTGHQAGVDAVTSQVETMG